MAVVSTNCLDFVNSFQQCTASGCVLKCIAAVGLPALLCLLWLQNQALFLLSGTHS